MFVHSSVFMCLFTSLTSVRIYKWMNMLPCGSPLLLVFITTTSSQDPAVLIKIKGRKRLVEEEEGVGDVY